MLVRILSRRAAEFSLKTLAGAITHPRSSFMPLLRIKATARRLSAWEQRTLDSIKDGLAGSDAGLTALLTTFNQLASGEEMPTLEEIRAGLRGVTRCPGRKRRHPRWAQRAGCTSA